MIKICHMLPNEVDTVWSVCSEFLKKSFLRRLKTYDMNDIYNNCKAGKWQLWLAVVDDEMVGSMVTVISAEPKNRVIHVLNLGGKKIKLWAAEIEKVLVELARLNNCIGATAVTRRGFSRLIPGFKEDGILMSKMLSEVKL